MHAPAEFQRHKLSVDDFHRMGEIGILHQDSRIELIDGELIDMPPIGSRHASIVDTLAVICARALDPGLARLSVQHPVSLPPHSEPVPDLMLLEFRPDAYLHALPVSRDVLLLVEVADSSLAYDRGKKLALYASHGIAEFWIVDARARSLEVFRNPAASGYAVRLQPAFDEAVSPLALPALRISASQLYP